MNILGDLPSVYEEKYPTARKGYKYCKCRRVISPGQKYYYAKGYWNEKWEKYRTCISCHALRNELDLYDGMPLFGELKEWAKETEFKFPIWR